MSENNGTNEWLKNWEALQRQYFETWNDLARKAPFAAPPGAAPGGFPGVNPFAAVPPGFPPGMSPFGAFASTPWQEGWERWLRPFATPDRQSETVERLIENAQSYIAAMQSLFGGARATGEGAAKPAQAGFDALRAAASAAGMPGFDAMANPFVQTLREAAGKGAQAFAEFPAAFAPYAERAREEGLSWLRMPAFGLAREHQEHYQRTALAFVEYQRTQREYDRLMLEAFRRGNERFAAKLAEYGEQPGRTIDSFKALYDLWIDAAEEAYAEIALSEEFGKAYGEMANAQMRLKQQIRIEVERASREFGMPTRTEIDSLSQRVHDLRGELRERGEGGREDEIAALRAEVADLRKSLAQTAAKPSIAAGRPAEPAPAAEPALAAKPQRAPRRVAASQSRAPAAVVRPRPVASAARKPAAKTASFADALAAMRRRVADKPNPAARADKKTGKRK